MCWIQGGNGLHFDAYGQAYSTGVWALNESSGAEDVAFTIELWLRAIKAQESPIFSVQGPSDGQGLNIAQSGTDLLVRGYFRNRSSRGQFCQLRLYDAFPSSQPIFVTITSGPEGTILYRDGKPQQPEHYASLLPERHIGRIVLGHGAGGIDPWTGDVLGLAVYNRWLPAEEVAQHYKDWPMHRPHLLQDTRALYTFNEHTGDIVHNYAGSAPSVIIPPRFKPLHPSVLVLPHPFRLHRIDTTLNILGFVPLGFFLCAYLTDVKHYSPTSAFVWALVLGALTSLSIELLQVFLPSRDSSLLDVINNVVGTAVGAFLPILTFDILRCGCLVFAFKHRACSLGGVTRDGQLSGRDPRPSRGGDIARIRENRDPQLPGGN